MKESESDSNSSSTESLYTLGDDFQSESETESKDKNSHCCHHGANKTHWRTT